MKNIDEIKNKVLKEDKIKNIFDHFSANEWDEISQKNNLSYGFILKYQDKLNFNYLDFSNVSEDFIIQNKEKIKNAHNGVCRLISTKLNLSENVINLFTDCFFFHPSNTKHNHEYRDDWSRLCQYQKLSINFLTKYEDYISWSSVSRCQNLSDELIINFNEYLDWDQISKRSDLTSDFVQKYSKYINFSSLFEYATLNETFCEEVIQHCKKFLNTVAWENLFKYQKLSDDFIDKYSKEISNYNVWSTVFKYQDYGKILGA